MTEGDLAKLKHDAGLENMPTSLTFELRWGVVGEGPRAYDWSDKPHRLVYDACAEVERLTAALSRAEAEREGFILAPRKPTPEMIEAAMPWAFPSDTDDLRENTKAVWEAMIAAHEACISRASPMEKP